MPQTLELSLRMLMDVILCVEREKAWLRQGEMRQLQHHGLTRAHSLHRKSHIYRKILGDCTACGVVNCSPVFGPTDVSRFGYELIWGTGNMLPVLGDLQKY